jgi:hypothetical protein
MTRPVTIDGADLGPLHLASTPIAVLSKYGLATYAGLSGDDPGGTRNRDVTFSVVLSAFEGSKLLGRRELRTIGPQEHVFISLDEKLAELGWREASLCVLHRVPSQYMADGRIGSGNGSDRKPDYRMYRTVVQYGTLGGAMGGLVYETSPNMNVTGRKPHFLSFTNKVYLCEGVDNYLVFLNYSISADYSHEAEVKLAFHDPDGRRVAETAIRVPPYDFACLRVNDVVTCARDPGFFSVSAASVTSSLIPLSVIVNRRNGGVSAEHSHPPQEYWMADWPFVNAMKLRAARYLFGG